jgi:hypothetical protein
MNQADYRAVDPMAQINHGLPTMTLAHRPVDGTNNTAGPSDTSPNGQSQVEESLEAYFNGSAFDPGSQQHGSIFHDPFQPNHVGASSHHRSPDYDGAPPSPGNRGGSTVQDEDDFQEWQKIEHPSQGPANNASRWGFIPFSQ